jgi:hypothetical protein
LNFRWAKPTHKYPWSELPTEVYGLRLGGRFRSGRLRSSGT